MVLAVYGGSFNPPHKGHLAAVKAAAEILSPDELLIIPTNLPPHKSLAEDAPPASQRLEMAELCFGEISCARVSDMEISRGGTSYTADTLKRLKNDRPDAEVMLLIGTDMFEYFEKWADFIWMLDNVTLVVLQRENGEEEKIRRHAKHLEDAYGARTVQILSKQFPASSTEIRKALRNAGGRAFLPDKVYEYIIKNRVYGARPELSWLRERAFAMLPPERVPHVKGCEKEAVRLAKRWGADGYEAAHAAILHDITKKVSLEEQLILCEKYGIIADDVERRSQKLLHAKTGAALARDRYGASNEVHEAIKWHTTGRADMSLLEKIMYIADYIEETRSFEGVEALRSLAYEELDRTVCLGLQMSYDELIEKNAFPHEDTLKALQWYKGDKE